MARGTILVVTSIIGQSSVLGPRLGLDVGDARIVVFAGLNGIGWLEYEAVEVAARPLNDGELAVGLVIAGMAGFELPGRYEGHEIPQARFVLETSHGIWEGFATAEAAEDRLRWRRGGMMAAVDAAHAVSVDEPAGVYRFAVISSGTDSGVRIRVEAPDGIHDVDVLAPDPGQGGGGIVLRRGRRLPIEVVEAIQRMLPSYLPATFTPERGRL